MSINSDVYRKSIRTEFGFLIDLYGFHEVPPIPPIADIYTEVHFKKNGWIIAVKNTAHGTKATLQLVSPENKRAFLGYLFKPKLKKKARRNQTDPFLTDLKIMARCLREYGTLILEGDDKKLRQAFKSAILLHENWLVQSGTMTEAQLVIWKQGQE
jgi:hypothetical protein